MDAPVVQRLGYVRDLSPNAAYDVIPSTDWNNADGSTQLISTTTVSRVNCTVIA
jgi:hypothetical protein